MNSLPTKPVLTLTIVKQMLIASEAKAIELGLSMTIAIVDDGAHPLALFRMDGIHAGTVEIAFAKAKSSVMFMRPTSKFSEALGEGAIGLIGLPNVLPFPGGLPLLIGHNLLGGIGASGASPEIDEVIAAAGLAIFEKQTKS